MVAVDGDRCGGGGEAIEGFRFFEREIEEWIERLQESC